MTTSCPTSTTSSIISSEKIQQELDDALEKSGLSKTSINNLLSSVANSITCDDECQKRENADKLKLKYDAAKDNLSNAPYEVNKTEKNYYEYIIGDDGYKKMLIDRYTKTAHDLKNKSIKKHDEIMKEIKVLYKDLEATKIYEKRMIELLKIRTQEFKQLKSAVEQDLGDTQKNDRKVDYENKEYKGLHNIRIWITVFYYLLIPLYLFLSDFFPAAKYKSIKIWILLILYCIFPLLINYISQLIFYLKDQINDYLDNKAPKNVYKDI